MAPKKRAKKRATAGTRKGRVRRPARRAPAPKQRRAAARSARGKVGGATGLGDVVEAVDIMVPELLARLAALEHMLIDKKMCTREELLRARAFVDMRRV